MLDCFWKFFAFFSLSVVCYIALYFLLFFSRFCEETETSEQFVSKYCRKRPEIRHANNLCVGTGPMECLTEMKENYVEKEPEIPCYPSWIENEMWVPPESALESCTTYKHYYRPHSFPPKVRKCTEVGKIAWILG